MPAAESVFSTDLPFPKRSGKVRDVYDLGESLLIVATDRISAYDVIMPTPIPGKGKILTSLSVFWFGMFPDVANHLIATEVGDYPKELAPFAPQLRGRSMLVKKTKVIPIECVARGYLAGSGWKEYRVSQTVCGVPLPEGLQQCSKLPDGPIFTPATKAEAGHDENISFDEAAKAVGLEVATEIMSRTLGIYSRAAAYAETRGILLADTKFEFGIKDGQIILIDEILTPDSSRFWPAVKYAPGRDQESFDKQFLRNWLEASDWAKTPPAPSLPPDVVAGTLARYQEAHERLTGRVCEL